MLPDTRFPVELHGTVRASRAKVGDPVEFRTIEPVLIGNGVVVPESTTLFGEVIFVRSDPGATPRFWIRIAVNSLRWQTGQACLNATVDSVYYVRSSYFGHLQHSQKVTFLEGIEIDPHLFRHASTDFFSSSREVVLRDGILLELKQFVPEDDEVGQTLSECRAAGK